ncbi:hypothetical protein CP488_02892 [Chthonomonas calidirosea]|nr:hypothetical protein CP488_02892 [Chthonomonas calidirosea]
MALDFDARGSIVYLSVATMPATRSEPWKPRCSSRPFTNPKRWGSVKGWYCGILIGVLGGLVVLPFTRNILAAQWETSLTSGYSSLVAPMHLSASDSARLEWVANAEPSDVLVQMGFIAASLDHPFSPTNFSVNTLARLVGLIQKHPNVAGLYALLVRVALQQESSEGITADVSLDPVPASRPNTLFSIAPQRAAILDIALRRGEQLEPKNAFWPAMRAWLYFSNREEQRGEKALERIASTSQWDSHLYEQVLGEWRLYAQVFGDQGALQKIEPLTLLSFPHLQALRAMAFYVHDRAEQDIAEGHLPQAFRLHLGLAHLGTILRDTAPWAYEALLGTDLVLIASTGDGTPLQGEGMVNSLATWEPYGRRYLTLLRRSGEETQALWLEHEIVKSLKLRRTLGLARAATPYDGVPPGVPLKALFSDWMLGVLTLQQMLGLLGSFCILGCAVLLIKRFPQTQLLVFLALAILFIGLLYLFSLLPSMGCALGVLISGVLLWLVGLSWLSNRLFDQEEQRRELSWKTGVLCVVLATGVTAALWGGLQAQIGQMHPLARVLSGLDSVGPHEDQAQMLVRWFFGLSFALVVCLVGGTGSLLLKHRPLEGAFQVVRSLLWPALAFMAVVYLCLLQVTIRQDARTAAAIQEAAINDREWVLTHTLSE